MGTHAWQPNYAVHPGELLAEMLDEHKLTQSWLAQRTGYTTKHVNQMVKGKAPITADAAVAIAIAFGRKGYARTLARMQADHDVWVALQNGLKPDD